MQTLLLAVGIVGPGVLLALAGLLWVRRRLPLSVLETQHEVAGVLFGIVGVMYSVLLAFVVFVVWEEFQDAKVAAVQEANDLGDLCRLAQGFPVPLRNQIWLRARAYARLVVDEEWEAMAQGRISPRAQEAMDDLWWIYGTMEPRTAREGALYGESLSRLADLSDARRLRLHASHDAMPAILWTVLWIGGLVTVLFTYFFGVHSLRSQIAMTGALTGMIAVILFLIAVLDHPFRGEVRVTAEPFRFVLERMEDIQKRGTLRGERSHRTLLRLRGSRPPG